MPVFLPNDLVRHLRSHIRPGEKLYGVVDGARDMELAYEAKCFYGQEIRSLFEGDMAPALAEVAPYMVPIELEQDYLKNWCRRWSTNAGILLATAANPDSLYSHLRSIFVVKDEEGAESFFRFYDPRVLRVYLTTCNSADRKEFFGPVRAFFVSDEDTEKLLHLDRD